MNYTITPETLDQLEAYRRDPSLNLRWEPLFLLPAWLKVWQASFAPQATTQNLVVREDAQIIGIAPLLFTGDTAAITGSVNVCDYFDFPLVPGKETAFYTALCEYLKKNGIKTLNAQVIRPDSSILTHLLPLAAQAGWKTTVEPDELSPEIMLPKTWDEYLESLDTKQRHELRRKLRRFESAGELTYKFISAPEAVSQFTDTFLKMFTESREDKAHFLTPEMEIYFRRLFLSMAETGVLRACLMELDNQPVAALVAFDYNDVIYLYNSGFDRQYNYLSVGILSKALLIKDSIERGKKKFDFLKGSEPYKFHLGGKEVRLQKCRLEIG
ncbi:MAG: GNAT family N-acetyltransferase [Dehalococcoidales bacterium]|nr:GNAT family N-acetyltransferase [Dehalococcoidales bacterium]